MDIDGGVDIPIMGSTAMRAYPRAHGKVLHLRVLFSAARANLARREELPDSDDHLSVALRLIGELSEKFTPCGIPDALRQLMIFHHILGREALHADDVILPHNLSRELLLVVPSHVSNMLLKTGDPQASLLTVLASLLLSGKLPLKASELLLTLGEILGVLVFLSIAGDNEIFNTEVQTDGGSGGFPEFLRDVLTVYRYKVFATGVSGYGSGGNSPFDFLRDLAFHQPKFREFDRVIKHLNGLIYANRAIALPMVMLLLKVWVSNFRLMVSDSAEKILIGCFEVLQRRLQCGGIYFL